MKISKEKCEKTIVGNILNNSVTATTWILCSIFEAGALTIGAFLSPSFYADFPDAGTLFPVSPAKTKKKIKYKEITIWQSLRRLEKYGFVEKTDSKYALTIKGENLFKRILKIKKVQNKPWDKKYRVVIFDIPESMRKSRNWLRFELYSLGYKKLQQSVFIGKKPLPENVILGIKENKISNCVNYLLIDKIYKNIM